MVAKINAVLCSKLLPHSELKTVISKDYYPKYVLLSHRFEARCNYYLKGFLLHVGNSLELCQKVLMGFYGMEEGRKKNELVIHYFSYHWEKLTGFLFH